MLSLLEQWARCFGFSCVLDHNSPLIGHGGKKRGVKEVRWRGRREQHLPKSGGEMVREKASMACCRAGRRERAWRAAGGNQQHSTGQGRGHTRLSCLLLNPPHATARSSHFGDQIQPLGGRLSTIAYVEQTGWKLIKEIVKMKIFLISDYICNSTRKPHILSVKSFIWFMILFFSSYNFLITCFLLLLFISHQCSSPCIQKCCYYFLFLEKEEPSPHPLSLTMAVLPLILLPSTSF